MSEKMEKPQVDIEAIMEEIREEVRKKGPYEPIPGLDDIPTSVLRKTDWNGALYDDRRFLLIILRRIQDEA